MSEVKKFDLNIEQILEDWKVYHAIREIIANAIDEQILTKSNDPEIFKDNEGRWHIRDYGRGLRYEHLTQKEDKEKLSNPYVIGKFGVGLKDALGVFDRNRVNVLIRSKYGDMRIGKSQKYGFTDIKTLHVFISPPSDPTQQGTEFILEGVKDEDIEFAKSLFLKYSDEYIIETTNYGQVLRRKENNPARIYVNGLRISEEDNFLFSYNITSLDRNIRKALNRERTNVGRSAYSERVKLILISSKNAEVKSLVAQDLKEYANGRNHDELNWVDVQEYAVKVLNTKKGVIFLTSKEQRDATMMVDEAKRMNYEIITIPEELKKRIAGQIDFEGMPVRDLERFTQEYNQSFEYEFINISELTPDERKVYKLTAKIFELIGGKPKEVNQVKISKTLSNLLKDTLGCFDQDTRNIVIKREALSNAEIYAGTLLHEVAHAVSGKPDVDRDFELKLSEFLGIITAKVLKSNG